MDIELAKKQTRLCENIASFMLNGDEEHIEEAINDPDFDPNHFDHNFEEPLIHTLLYMTNDDKDEIQNLIMCIGHLIHHPDFDPNAADSFNETALALCARRKEFAPIAKILMALPETDLWCKSAIGLTIKDLATKYDNKIFLEELEKAENNEFEVHGIPHLRASVAVS